MDGGEQPVQPDTSANQLSKHDLRELKKQQKLEQRQQQSSVAVAQNTKKKTITYSVIGVLILLAGFVLWKWSVNNITGLVAVTIGDHPTTGPADAKVSLIIFGDLQCPFTKKFWFNAFPKIVEKYGDKIKIAFWPTPTAKHNYDRASAQAAYCANDQGKFWEYAKIVFERQGQAIDDQLLSYAQELGLDTGAFHDCFSSGKYKDKVQEDYLAARDFGVVQTPTININGNVLSGDLPFEDYQTFIEFASQ